MVPAGELLQRLLNLRVTSKGLQAFVEPGLEADQPDVITARQDLVMDEHLSQVLERARWRFAVERSWLSASSRVPTRWRISAGAVPRIQVRMLCGRLVEDSSRMSRCRRRSGGLLGCRIAVRSSVRTQHAQNPPRIRSPSFWQRSQVRLVVMPAQSPQIRSPLGERPGRRRSVLQCAQMPCVLTAAVKQAPQMFPSGQRTRILGTILVQRPQRWVPMVRGRPRPRSSLVIRPKDPGADGPVGLQERNVGGGADGLGAGRPDARGGVCHELVHLNVEYVGQGDEDLERDPFGVLHRQPVDLRLGQSDPAITQRADQVAAVAHPSPGHQLPNMPLIFHLAFYCGSTPHSPKVGVRMLREKSGTIK